MSHWQMTACPMSPGTATCPFRDVGTPGLGHTADEETAVGPARGKAGQLAWSPAGPAAARGPT